MLACVVMIGCSDRATSEPDRHLTLLQTWHGVVADDALRNIAGSAPVITSDDSWRQVWRAWRGDTAIPRIDFSEHVVLVSTVGGPNQIRVEGRVDTQGNVRLAIAASKIGGPGFGYLFALVERDGLRSIAGHPLPP